MWEILDYLTPEGREPFREWLASLGDRMAKARIAARVQRLAAGNFGDCKPLDGGVWELRIDHGPGYRVYYARAGERLILLLVGGDKRHQQADIETAQGLLEGLEEEEPMKASRPHDETMAELLREDPAFADEYLTASLEALDEPGGQEALLMALRQVAQAQGMDAVAQRAGIQRESLYRALSPKGNPTLKTLLAVLDAAGLRLAVTRRDGVHEAA